MNKQLVLALLTGALLSNLAFAQDQNSGYDEIRKDIAALAARLQKLEEENAALKQQNERLESALAAQTPPPASTSTPPVSPVAAVTSTSSPAAAPPAAPKQWYEKIKVSGYVFGDAYGLIDHHNPAVEDQTGFWIRRGYLTFDSAITDTWSSRLRFEVNSPGNFTTNGLLDPYVKDAYLAWKDEVRELYFGMSPSPTWDFIESFWGYRQIEKTPLDLYRMGNSRDIGIAYKDTAAGGKVFYHAMVGNGAGTGSETNEGKKAMFSIGYNLTPSFTAQFYADYEDRPNHTNRNTWQGFLGLRTEQARYGLLYAWQNREQQGAPDAPVSVASIFGAWNLTEKSSFMARYDHSFEGYPDANQIPYLVFANNTKFDFAILSWSYQYNTQISFGPNLEYTMYHETDGVAAPDNDLMIRGTLFYQF